MMEIKVLGSGCARCQTLEKLTRQAAEELSLDANIEKIEDFQKIMEYGILRTPGLVIDGKVVLSGQIPKLAELKDMISQNS
jgi:small redox-active disulfide protein 2